MKNIPFCNEKFWLSWIGQLILLPFGLFFGMCFLQVMPYYCAYHSKTWGEKISLVLIGICFNLFHVGLFIAAMNPPHK